MKTEVKSCYLATGRTGFSLVEVTLAMAVMAVGLIAILGLIPQGVTSSRNAVDNTLAATIVHDDLNVIRRTALTVPWPPTVQPDTCYDAAGNQVPCASVDSYFHEHLISQASSVPNLLVVVAVISWPAKSASPLNNITNVTQIANYQQ
jgi:Tfp pilus assembly protein PilV